MSVSHCAGLRPLSFAVPSRVWMAAARFPAHSGPVISQFFLPSAMGRIVFSMGLLSIGRCPLPTVWARVCSNQSRNDYRIDRLFFGTQLLPGFGR